jgi:hypothetical protein
MAAITSQYQILGCSMNSNAHFCKIWADGLQISGLPAKSQQKQFFMGLKEVRNEENEEILCPFGYRNT